MGIDRNRTHTDVERMVGRSVAVSDSEEIASKIYNFLKWFLFRFMPIAIGSTGWVLWMLTW